MEKELQQPKKRSWNISTLISQGSGGGGEGQGVGGRKKHTRRTLNHNHPTSQSFPGGSSIPTSQTWQMEGRQAELDTLPSAKNRSPHLLPAPLHRR